MSSFRNRLLALIIGLVIVTQSVTLFAVLASTARDQRARADEQLRAGGAVVEQFISYRGDQLANAVAVMAADYGFRSAVASGDPATMLSAAMNHAVRIRADLVLLMDTDGRVLTSSAQDAAERSSALKELVTETQGAREHAHFDILGNHLYQFFVAPVRAPETIGWVAMGFAVDDALAKSIHDLVGAQVSLVALRQGRHILVATTLTGNERADFVAHDAWSVAASGSSGGEHQEARDYLTYAFPLEQSAGSIGVLLQKPMSEVLAPYRAQRNALIAIASIALGSAIAIALLLGRSATRPIGELVRAARRIQAGTYDKAVEVRGGEEFRSLAATFNAMQRDIAEREARITHDAYHDALTGLSNRAFVEHHLGELARATPAAQAALIVIEVRNFGEINASLGHHVGDEALREAAHRLRQNTGAQDLVARLAANQFLIVARDCTLARAPLLAEQLSGAIRHGFHLPTFSLELHVDAGVCCFPEHGSTPEELLRHVQIALEDARDARARVAVYRAGRDEQLRRRLALVGDLRHAIEHDELSLVYQPKVAVATRSVLSLEALVRWTHPKLGPVSPAEFIPIAEQTGGARRLTSWVLNAAIRQMAAWRRDGLDMEVAVNLSAPDILDPQLGDEILAALNSYGIAATRLVLEITESAVMRDAPLAARNMQLLRIAGVRFAIDDFGTGYSSLSQLSRLPVDELKIDRSFIMHAHERRDDVTIVMSTIELAHSMGLKVVAEGVENAEAWNLLRKLGCDFAQGYLISRPLPVADVMAFVQQANQLLPASDSTVRQIRALEELSDTGRRRQRSD
ncbi:MAG TPA: EAL domain-containing protein [Steroidobacteraceae bacterium]|nr:EAL domain-containing protein [Steroidobacteraceae bacterium]